jgi:hypothetical protein
MGSWLYSASKPATRDGSVACRRCMFSMPACAYQLRMSGHVATLRAITDNLFDKRYWKDAGQYLGDGYVHWARRARPACRCNMISERYPRRWAASHHLTRVISHGMGAEPVISTGRR